MGPGPTPSPPPSPGPPPQVPIRLQIRTPPDPRDLSLSAPRAGGPTRPSQRPWDSHAPGSQVYRSPSPSLPSPPTRPYAVGEVDRGRRPIPTEIRARPLLRSRLGAR